MRNVCVYTHTQYPILEPNSVSTIYTCTCTLHRRAIVRVHLQSIHMSHVGLHVVYTNTVDVYTYTHTCTGHTYTPSCPIHPASEESTVNLECLEYRLSPQPGSYCPPHLASLQTLSQRFPPPNHLLPHPPSHLPSSPLHHLPNLQEQNRCLQTVHSRVLGRCTEIFNVV